MLEPVDLVKAPYPPVAEPTTLVTFLLQGLRSVNRIELFGSWDNFTTAYPMSRDTRRGRGYWRGIHTFKNIICDGDLSSDARTHRDGALRVGGLYWYFYRLDGYEDYHNAAEPTTTSCPLLPGQTVNILEVPWELPITPKPGKFQAEPNSVMTLNPDDRWAPLKRKRDPHESNSTKRNISSHVCRRLSKAAKRLHTAHCTFTGHLINGVSELLTATELTSYCRPRPTSCPAAIDSEDISRNPDPNPRFAWRGVSGAGSRSQSRDVRGSSVSTSHSAEDSELVDSTLIGSPKPQALPPILLENIYTLLQRNRYLPSRARTAVASNSSSNNNLEPSKEAATTSSWNGKRRGRPFSAASTFASTGPSGKDQPLSDVEQVTKRMKSLRLRIACAKLRKMQNDLDQSNVDTSWILNSLPETYSGIFQNFGGRDEPRGELEGSLNTSTALEELSNSPPQLSSCSRGSIMWTPDTNSLFGTSEGGLGYSFRTSIRDSVEFQVAVHNGTDLGESIVQESIKSPDRIGVRFSSLGLDSQETIKPADGRQQDKRLDPVRNPLGGTSSAGSSYLDAERRDDHEVISAPEINTSTNDLMNDLHFLGKAIA